MKIIDVMTVVNKNFLPILGFGAPGSIPSIFSEYGLSFFRIPTGSKEKNTIHHIIT